MGARVVGLIPAKGLSDRVPYKNLVDLCGRPLIEWTIEAAENARSLDAVLVSTEDSRVAAVARHGAAAVIMRPKELATPHATSLSVVLHALADPLCADAEVLVLLQPTSPLRTADDIDACCELLERSGGDAVISVVPAPENLMFTVGHAGRLRPCASTSHVVENGAVWALRTEPLRRGDGFYSGVTYAYQMPAERSVDVDTLADLERAASLLGKATAHV